jgi:two-component system, NtrC family, sensor kinase
MYFGLVAGVAELVHMRQPSSGPVGLILAVVVTALLFDPVRKWIQDRIDQFFYRTRYDYRRTLLEFGRELSSETDLNAMLSSLMDRLSRTLAVDRMAIFLAGEDASRAICAGQVLWLVRAGQSRSVFSERAAAGACGAPLLREHAPGTARGTRARSKPSPAGSELLHSLPRAAEDVAVLGLGKTTQGRFLSSEDMELLETLGGYLGIAIQNGQLYASLQQKAAEYERLKDFNENIVESINVGVMALDMEDRIESWNAQMEVMYAVPRWQT